MNVCLMLVYPSVLNRYSICCYSSWNVKWVLFVIALQSNRVIFWGHNEGFKTTVYKLIGSSIDGITQKSFFRMLGVCNSRTFRLPFWVDNGHFSYTPVQNFILTQHPIYTYTFVLSHTHIYRSSSLMCVCVFRQSR